jgi:hypothetical protein
MIQGTLFLYLLGLALTGTPQTRPGFSGTWVLEHQQSAPDAPRQLMIRQSKTCAAPFEHVEELTVERTFDDDVRVLTYRVGIGGGVVGGIGEDGRGSGPGGQRPTSKYSVRWDLRGRLVIETASYSGLTRAAGPYTEHTELWWLDATGALVMTLEHRTESGETTRTLTYRREE